MVGKLVVILEFSIFYIEFKTIHSDPSTSKFCKLDFPQCTDLSTDPLPWYQVDRKFHIFLDNFNHSISLSFLRIIKNELMSLKSPIFRVPKIRNIIKFQRLNRLIRIALSII
jgi:hypothetical protein